jgi:hypothetical protein
MRSKVLALVTMLLLLPISVLSGEAKSADDDKTQRSSGSSILWREPSDIETRNLFHGPGGETGQPKEPFKFIEEDRGGSSPKFVVEDSQGVRWKVKLGDEAKPETAATRLLWAVGYFTDVNYYLPQLRVAGMRKLSRGQKYVSADGIVNDARLERIEKGTKKIDDWSWFDNPFVGTREFSGLRVMMALMNSWDLKEMNNAVYEVEGQELRHVVSDLGASFGRTGGDWKRSKGDLQHYLESQFIDETKSTTVDLVLRSRPPALYVAALPYYRERVRMGKVAEGIPRDHARWIGQWLAKLSDDQLRDAFRAAGYTPQETAAYAQKVRERVSQLNEL